MSNYINGYNHPRFHILTPEGVHFETIDLDLTGEGGLVESIENRSIIRELDNGKISVLPRLGRLTFTLDYSSYSSKTNSLKIAKLINYAQATDTNGNEAYKIYLSPRTDLVNLRKFDVVFSSTNIDIGLLKGGAMAAGNRLLTLEFRTRKPEPLNWYDPDDIYVAFNESFAQEEEL